MADTGLHRDLRGVVRRKGVIVDDSGSGGVSGHYVDLALGSGDARRIVVPARVFIAARPGATLHRDAFSRVFVVNGRAIAVPLSDFLWPYAALVLITLIVGILACWYPGIPTRRDRGRIVSRPPDDPHRGT